MLNSGDVVILNIPYTGTQTKENEKHDRFFKGLFFVKRIRHDFDISAGNKHTMHMTLVKDSVEDRLSDSGMPEPKSKKGPFLYEEFY